MNGIETKEQNNLNKTIGEFVAEDFRTAEVFNKYGVDFCCGGNVPLSSICEVKGLEMTAFLSELEAAKSEPLERNRNYAAWELPFLADYIVTTHHGYLDENTSQIAVYAHKIAEVHGAHHPEVVEIARIFDIIANDMTAHLREEEEVLFPGIKRIYAARKTGEDPVEEDMEAIKACLTKLNLEHEAIGDAVHEIRHLSKGYEIPSDVCNTFVVTYRKLKEFEEDLHKHVHLENNILFPKANLLCN